MHFQYSKYLHVYRDSEICQWKRIWSFCQFNMNGCLVFMFLSFKIFIREWNNKFMNQPTSFLEEGGKWIIHFPLFSLIIFDQKFIYSPWFYLWIPVILWIMSLLECVEIECDAFQWIYLDIGFIITWILHQII